MVLAISFACASRKRGDSKYQDAIGHVNSALEHAHEVLLPGTHSGIEAILFLALFALLDPQRFNCWHLIGFASRMLCDLGEHQRRLGDTNHYPLRQAQPIPETYSGLFKTVYALDR